MDNFAHFPWAHSWCSHLALPLGTDDLWSSYSHAWWSSACWLEHLDSPLLGLSEGWLEHVYMVVEFYQGREETSKFRFRTHTVSLILNSIGQSKTQDHPTFTGWETNLISCNEKLQTSVTVLNSPYHLFILSK